MFTDVQGSSIGRKSNITRDFVGQLTTPCSFVEGGEPAAFSEKFQQMPCLFYEFRMRRSYGVSGGMIVGENRRFEIGFSSGHR